MAEWLSEDFPLFNKLTRAEQHKLVAIARIIILEKHWYGTEGPPPIPRVQLCIAAQAALLLLHIDHNYYQRTRTIIVSDELHGSGLDNTQHVHGYTSHYGPVVVRWNSAIGGAMYPNDGFNVVLHEFAHQLDMLDNVTDGTPPIEDNIQRANWIHVMTRRYEQLVELTGAGRKYLLNDYAATAPTEFFAVATEVFFEKPRQMKKKTPDLYDILRDYFQQDPAEWDW